MSQPSWEDVMKPLSESPLWPVLRRQACRVIESDMRSIGITDQGISSSDINHTIFSYARHISQTVLYAEDVLKELENAV